MVRQVAGGSPPSTGWSSPPARVHVAHAGRWSDEASGVHAVALGHGRATRGEVAMVATLRAARRAVLELGAEAPPETLIVAALQGANVELMRLRERQRVFDALGASMAIACLRLPFVHLAHVGGALFVARGPEMRLRDEASAHSLGASARLRIGRSELPVDAGDDIWICAGFSAETAPSYGNVDLDWLRREAGEDPACMHLRA